MAKLKTKLVAVALSLITLTASPLSAVRAADDAKGKYVSEVYIAYGKTEDQARQWLIDNGWEPVDGNFNAGKESKLDEDQKVAAVMGIRRTNNASEAVTDMAVMNMGIKGKEGYSFSDYKALVDMKRAEIDEFLDCFTPVLQEYRANVTGKGSASGKARADLAKELLNKFYDGEPAKTEKEKEDVHDTGKPLGDLFIQQTRREMGDDAYYKDWGNHADFEQIILKSAGPAVSAVEQALAMATDTAQTTWLERLPDYPLDLMVSEIGAFIPKYEGQNLSESAALSALQSEYGDAAKSLAADYDTIQQEMIWYEAYMENNGLWQEDGESDEDYATRINAFFTEMKETDEDLYDEEYYHYRNAFMICDLLYATDFQGEWGETLGDFFNPEDGVNYGEDTDNFLPFAAALSEGQRAGLQFLTLTALFRVGMNTEESAKELLPEVSEVFGDKESISVYSGMNRNIFRGGVALTSDALMRRNLAQDDPFGNLWEFKGVVNITLYAMGIVGVLTLASVAASKLPTIIKNAIKIADLNAAIKKAGDNIAVLSKGSDINKSLAEVMGQHCADYCDEIDKLQKEIYKVSSAQQILLGVGGSLILVAAGYKIYQYTQYFSRKFSPIPMMIVDEADIVTYLTDEKGNPILDENGQQEKEIKFDQYVYYDVVRCNRQAEEIKKLDLGDPQDGVDKYPKWGCGDANDLNGDYGKQWLSLYTVKSSAKGNPILADSLKLQYGSKTQPAGTTKALHFFCYSFPMNIADEAYCFNDKKGGIYFFWDEDTKAFASGTASTFSTGQLALTGIGGLALGIIGATVVMMLSKKRKEEKPEAPAAA